MADLALEFWGTIGYEKYTSSSPPSDGTWSVSGPGGYGANNWDNPNGWGAVQNTDNKTFDMCPPSDAPVGEYYMFIGDKDFRTNPPHCAGQATFFVVAEPDKEPGPGDKPC